MTGCRLSPAAAEDLADIHRYSRRQWSVARADRYTAKIRADIANAAEHPARGHAEPALRSPYRRRASQSHAIFYRIEDDGIVIVRILHQSMDPARHL